MSVANPNLHFQPEGHGTIVRQRHLHVGTEHAGFHGRMLCPRAVHEIFKQTPAFLRHRRRRETRTHALVRIRGERELRHQQHTAAGVRDTQIHLAGRIREHAITQQPLQHPLGPGLVIVPLNADKNQQARSDGRDGFAVHVNPGVAHALQESDHGAGIIQYIIRRKRSIFVAPIKALRDSTMPALPDKDQQILAAHAGLVHAVVRTCHNRDLMPQLEQLLKLSEENGWTQLVVSIRRILGGQRDTDVLLGLDEEDRAIAEAILRGLQNPETLPDLNATPDPEHAAPGLASMIAASRHGNVEALKALADMATQMRQAGGDMARLASALSQMEQGEDDVEKLSRGMSPAGLKLVEMILEELRKRG